MQTQLLNQQTSSLFVDPTDIILKPSLLTVVGGVKTTMTEHLSNPFTAYNSAAPDATTLVGNWYEERCLKDTTGVTRGQV